MEAREWNCCLQCIQGKTIYDRPAIPIGSIIETNYGTGPYRVVTISICFCQGLSWIHRTDVEFPMQPHWNIACIDIEHEKEMKIMKKKPDSWLSFYVEKGGRFLSIWNIGDEIFVLEKPEPVAVQGSFEW